MVIYDAELFQQRNQFFACSPGWRCIALGLFAGEIGYDLDGLGEDVSLLGGREVADVFVSVAV